MITVDEALQKVLALAGPVQSEEIALADGFGRVLAKPVSARLTQPPFDAAAMDGYAIRQADQKRSLRVIGESAAGRPWDGTAQPGTAIRIFTGAAVPAGYDRVVMQEHVSRDGDEIRVTTAQQHDNIRPQGNDFHEGLTFDPCRRLTARDLGLIAAMNVPHLTVPRRPRVAILPGGDELVPPGTTPGPGQIVSSNDLAIAAIARRAGADVTLLPIAADTEASLRDSLNRAADADLIVTIGGASVGDHDLIGKVTEGVGIERAFYKIAMRPGKPLIAGRIGHSAMIGLPGNPVSSIVCAELFIRPLLHAMQGLPPEERVRLGRLTAPLGPEGDRQHYLRATLAEADGYPQLTPLADQDSARLGLLAQADALLVRPAGDPPREAGDTVAFIALD
ncbi:molybdopterin molybdotransferase MoeA [Paracoccus xiamenensis]|uniref:molybdopterin molybdotransferase MoeA n=1 Tax=Paracoccus xiamenensis TaxID=2714901 RepID=UPI0014093920|nr:gephyrin-like molybdotransferase Glp [Paracoccus xiamenensis]NHF72243.1 molybdopterin molybdotransferase MoeA [Paracoccus xiamenensis]